MNVSNAASYYRIFFNRITDELSKTFEKVMVDNGLSPGAFGVKYCDTLIVEFPTYVDAEVFFHAVCLAYDEQDETTCYGSFRNMDNAKKAMKELSIEAPANFNTQCRFSGPTSFYRKEGYIEFFRPVEIRAIRTVSKETSITVDGKVYTSTEETPVYSSWYESLPYRATVGFKTFSKISITKN